jgi:hypothetical protein
MSSGSKKGTRIYYPFFSKSPGKRIPFRFPSRAPKERDTRWQGIFTSLTVSLIVFPSQSPVWQSPPCSLTGSPRTGVLPHQRYWPSEGILFITFIRSCVCAEVPKKEPSYIQEKHKVTVHRAPVDGRTTYNGVRPGSPRGSLTTLLSLPQCHAAFGTIASTLAWVDQSPVSQRVS